MCWARQAHLEALDYTRHHLVLEAAVFSLRVLADGHQVHPVVTRLVPWDAEAGPYVGIQLQLLTQGQVE